MQLKTETKVGVFVIVAIGIFIYMIFHLRVFRFHLKNYCNYEVCFDNVSGLSEKSDVKIAGVKVGWVDKVSLFSTDRRAKVRLMVQSHYQLHQDAYAMIRQEGLLGPRYVELIPGDPSQPIITAGSSLCRDGTCGVSMDALLGQVKKLAENVTQVSASLNHALGGDGQADKLHTMVDNLVRASEKIVAISDSLDRVVGRNEKDITQAIKDLSSFAHEVKETLPQLRADINKVAGRLDSEVLPAFKESAQKIAQVIDRDFNRVANKLEQAATSVETVVDQAHCGKGLLCKLINDEDMCNDVKAAARGIKDNLAVLNNLGVVVDVRAESMLKPVDCYPHCNNLGYFDMRFNTSPSWFYLLQMVRSEKGWPSRWYEHADYFKQNCAPLNPNKPVIDDGDVMVAPNVEHKSIRRNDVRFDIQAGKVFNDLTVRIGTMERSFGFGLDYTLPIDIPYFKWVTGIELYDFHGQNRWICDRCPHLKWFNRMYLGNLYLTFGGDDLISSSQRKGFVGGGLRFSDDDLKHVASKFGMLGMGS